MATSPFLGQRKDFSFPHTLQIAKQSLLVQSPGSVNMSFKFWSPVVTEPNVRRRGCRLGIFLDGVVSTALLDRVIGGRDDILCRSGSIVRFQEEIVKDLERNTRRFCDMNDRGKLI